MASAVSDYEDSVDGSNATFEDGMQGSFDTSTPLPETRFRNVTTRTRRSAGASVEDMGDDMYKEDEAVLEISRVLNLIYRDPGYLDDDYEASEIAKRNIAKICKFTHTLRRFMKDRLFRDDLLLALLFPPEDQLIDELCAFFQKHFEEAYEGFDKQTYVIVNDFIQLAAIVFDQHIKRPPVMGPLLKFISISLAFGTDRAIYSVKNEDDLFKKGDWDLGDIFFNKIMDESTVELRKSRNSFYTCFRDDGHDPRIELARARAAAASSASSTPSAPSTGKMPTAPTTATGFGNIPISSIAPPKTTTTASISTSSATMGSGIKTTASPGTSTSSTGATGGMGATSTPKTTLTGAIPKVPIVTRTPSIDPSTISTPAGATFVTSSAPSNPASTAPYTTFHGATTIPTTSIKSPISSTGVPASSGVAAPVGSMGFVYTPSSCDPRAVWEAHQRNLKRDQDIRDYLSTTYGPVTSVAPLPYVQASTRSTISHHTGPHFSIPSFATGGNAVPIRSIMKTPEPKRTSFSGVDDIMSYSPTVTETEAETEKEEKYRERKKFAPSLSQQSRARREVDSSDDYSESEIDIHLQNKKDYVNPRPTTPAHIQRGARDSQYKESDADIGQVYDASTSFREIQPPPSDMWKDFIGGLVSSGCDSSRAEELAAMSAVMAQLAASMTASHKKQNKKIIEEIPPPPPDTDFSADSFDYDIAGTTLASVLGPRFRNTRFPSEPIKKMVMRNIFQKIASHPESCYEARLLAASQLGKDDPVVRGRAEIQALTSDPYVAWQDNEDFVPPPLLGKNELTNEVLKTLQTRLGIAPNERFDFSELSGVRLKNLLMSLRSVISSFSLKASDAYALLRRLSKGLSTDAIWMAENDHKLAFADYWMSLQKTQRRIFSAEYDKKLKNLMAQDHVDNLEQSLHQILIWNDRKHEIEADVNVRRLLCQRNTLRDFRTFIRKHYGPYLSQINTAFAEKLRSVAAQKNLPNFTNESIFHAGKSYLFFEICCDILSQCEPEPYVKEKFRDDRNQGRRVRINEMNMSPAATPEPPSNGFKQIRGPTPGPGQFNKPYQNKGQQNNSYRNMERPPTRNQNMNGKESKMTRKVDYRCHLCNIPGHSYRDCRKYPGEAIGKKECSNCHGLHTSECKMKNTNQGASQTDSHLKNAMSQIMEMFGMQQNVSEGQQRQQYQNTNSYNNYNRANTPGGGRDFGQNRPNDRFNNNYSNQRPRSAYRRDGYRPFTPGPNRSGYNQGYRTNYNNVNGYPGNNYRTHRQGYNQDDRNQGFGQKSQEAAVRVDHRQIQYLEDMLKQMKNQKMSGHVPQGQGHGLGNDGQQPLNSTVVLDSMEGSFNQ